MKIDAAVDRSREEFVQRFRTKYTGEPHLPLWMAAEVMTFGQLFTFFRHLHRSEKKTLARAFDLYPPVLESWLHTLNFTRNACAHHARLWNREIPIRPKLPNIRHRPEWYNPVKIDNRRVFAILTILKYLLSYITPQSDWAGRLLSLIHEYDEIPIRQMGFPENWQESALWRETPEPLLAPLALDLSRIHWVIVGGESGPKARPMAEAWVQDVRGQCQAQRVPFFFKQWGGVRKKRNGRLLDGRTWDEMPAHSLLSPA